MLLFFLVFKKNRLKFKPKFLVKINSETVAVSILENYTGQPSYPLLEQNQAWHSDYDAKGVYLNDCCL